MVSLTTYVLFAALVTLSISSSHAEEKQEGGGVTKTGDWDYDNTAWETVSEKYATCGTGKEQSPINVESCHALSQCDRPSINLHESEVQHHAETNNFAMECENEEGKPCSEIAYRGTTYKMLQFHAHSPSENVLNGQSYPLEIHFVHKSDDDKLAVLGVFFKLGKHNDDIQKVLDAAEKKGSTHIDLSNFYHEHGMMCSFRGSLTTPPCSEGVSWFVSCQETSTAQWAVHEISADQFFKYRMLVGGIKNNRPLQDKNGRDVACVH